MFHVMKGDRMMAEYVKLSTAEHPGVWACFRCETVFNPTYLRGVKMTPSTINAFVTQKIEKKS